MHNPENLKALIVQSLDADKAEDIKSIDLRGDTPIADFIIIATGTSSRAVGSLADKLHDRLHALGIRDIRIEGKDLCNWVIVDAGDVVVHIFRPEVREFYNLEKMWTPQPAAHGITPLPAR